MFFRRTAKAIGEFAKSQPGPDEIGCVNFLGQTLVTALLLTLFMGGTMLLVVFVLSWAAK